MNISILEKSCERCDSVYSPAAYLLALTRFIDHYFTTAGNTKNMDYLFGRMQRSYLRDLSINCEEIQKNIPQPQIAKKVLLNYIKNKTNHSTDDEVFLTLRNSLNPPSFSYYGALFKEYLYILGTSLEELHSIFINPNEPSIEYLAEKMGISDSEFSLMIGETPENWDDYWDAVKEYLVLEIEIGDISVQDLEFFKNLFNIRDEIEEIYFVLDNVENTFKTPFEFLLSFVGIKPEATSIDNLAFKRIIQFHILQNALNMDIVDLLIVLHQLRVVDISYQIVEQVYNIQNMLLNINTTPRALAKLRFDELKFEKIANILEIKKDTLERVFQVHIHDITEPQVIYEIWKHMYDLNLIDISVEKFFWLRIPLTDYSPEPLTEMLGYTYEEILDAINSENIENISEILSISTDDLDDLFKLKIRGPNREVITLENLKEGGLNSLDLLYRPYRVARFLRLDLTEYKEILKLVGLSKKDPNKIKYEDILNVLKTVIFTRKIGGDLSRISMIAKECTKPKTLKEKMGIETPGWWKDYKKFSELRIENLAEKLNVSQDLLEQFVYRQGASERQYIKKIQSNKIYVRDDLIGSYDEGWLLYNPLMDSYYSIKNADKNVVVLAKRPSDLAVDNVIEILKKERDFSWIESPISKPDPETIEEDFTKEDLIKRTDNIRRWVTLALELKMDIVSLFNKLVFYDIHFAIEDLDNFYKVCLIVISLHDLKNIVSLFSWSKTTHINQFLSLDQVIKADHLLNLARYLDLDLYAIKNLDIWEFGVTKEDVPNIYNLLENRLEKEQFESEIQKSKNSILESTRDSLLNYAISSNFPSTEEYLPQTVELLSNELLIDLQVSKNVSTNEILQAIESLQTYILRVQKGLENIYDISISQFLDFINSLTTIEDITGSIMDDITHGYGDQFLDYGIGPVVAARMLETREQLGGAFTHISQLEGIQGLGADKIRDMITTFQLVHATQLKGEWWENMEKDWKWMRKYVLWEAAQKVFLYPENWVMPELRDNKTPFFEDLEDELSQGEVTQALAEKSLSGFIDNLHPLSSIHVSGTVYDEKDKTLHIFARSLVDEEKTYYRSLKNQTIWSPWVEVKLEINSDHLNPFLAYNRLYVFWIETEIEENDTISYEHTLCFAYSLDMKKWSKKITFELKDGSYDSDEDAKRHLFTGFEFPWMGIYNAEGIHIHINDTPPLNKWNPETDPSCRLLLTCQDNIDFILPDYPIQIRDCNLFDWNFEFPSSFNIIPDSMAFFYKDKTSSEAIMGYINNRAETIREEWPGKATVSEVLNDNIPVNLMNFLYCDGSTLKIISSKFEPFMTSGFEDSFDDNTLDLDNWAPEPKEGSITEQGGKLKLQNDGICDWWGVGVEWLSPYNAPHAITPISAGYENHWAVQVEITDPSTMSLANHYGLMLYKNLQNVLFFGHYCLTNPLEQTLPPVVDITPITWGIAIGSIIEGIGSIIEGIIGVIGTVVDLIEPTVIRTPQQELRIEKIVNNFSTQNVRSISASPNQMKFLRIERAGDTYYFYYSSDGRLWTNFYSINSLGFTPTHIGLFKKNWVHRTTSWAVFDEFSMYPVTPLSNVTLIDLTSKNILNNIDSTFKIDDAVAIGPNSYFFCSDQYRCYIIIVHLDLDGNNITQNIVIRHLNYGKYCKLKDKLFREGLDYFFHPDFQSEDLGKPFSEIYSYNSALFFDEHQLPSRKIEFHGPNKLYNWELFFHIPYLIADALSQNRKFEPAEEWYKYICNPYKKPNIEWKFRPFREENDEPFYSYISDPEDIDIWRKNPFNPHALARVRPFTYQKSILLSFIENLLDWADQDFTRDTQESINAARVRYLFVEQLLDLSEFEEEIPQDIVDRTLLDMNQASIDEATSDLSQVVESPEDLDFTGFLPELWVDPLETLIDPYSLEAMLINTKVGCIPENPLFKSLLYQLESNIRKIRAGRNIAGIKRILPLFEASIDPMSVISAVASGIGLENLNYSSSSNIGPYRFVFLIERAKSLVQLVIQAGNALLTAIEKKEAEEFSYLKVQQELRLTKANIHLRKLQVIETQDNLKMAEKQTIRSQFIKKHYQGLIDRGKNQYEISALNYLDLSIILLYVSMGLQAGAAVAHLLPTISGTVGTELSTTVSHGGENIARNLGTLASISSTEASVLSYRSSIASMNANFARREEEWTFQKDLATKDETISKQNEMIAKDRVKIAEMEQKIAEMQAEFADETLEFLKEKFTNKDLYKWMVKTLSKMFYGFYNLAYTAARMAQATMEFERNESYDFISYGYWDSERKGLLSGDQLLLDINRMDDAYINNNARKLEITKHISLAQMAPEAIIQLREKGKAVFAIPMSWFDRDFPGHYQRIIKSVKFSLLALIGPGTNVNATLSTLGSSLVVVNPMEDLVPVQRIQSIALSGASNSTGLFDLNYRDERYLPFEGSGVAVTWEIEMPKASNKFNFETIIDAILTIDYTALSDLDYKQRIIEELGTEFRGMVPLSVRTTFPDAWYIFHNPMFNNTNNHVEPYSLVFNVTRPMFPPNEEDHKIESVSLKFNLGDLNIRIPLRIKFTSDKGQTGEITRRTATDGTLILEDDFTRFSPFGKWELKIDRDRVPEILWARDEQGNPIMIQNVDKKSESHLLNTEKITNLIFGFTYKAELEWPPD